MRLKQLDQIDTHPMSIDIAALSVSSPYGEVVGEGVGDGEVGLSVVPELQAPNRAAKLIKSVIAKALMFISYELLTKKKLTMESAGGF